MVTLNTPYATSPLIGGYTLQVNEFGSTAALTLTTDGNPDFAIANSAVAVASNGMPAAYSSIYFGSHWGTKSATNALPVAVSSIKGGGVALTSWSIDRSAVASGSVYDCAYDIWFDPSATGNQGNGTSTEMMVWLAYAGCQPAGSKVATAQIINGISFDIWYSANGKGILSYVMTAASSAVNNLDIGLLAQDAINRGWLTAAHYLTDVEAGFELWTNGTGLKTNSFSVSIGSLPVAISASASVDKPTPAHGDTVTLTYAVSGNTGSGAQQITVTGNVNVGGVNYPVTVPLTLPATAGLPVTYSTPTAPGLTFQTTGNPAVFTALIP